LRRQLGLDILANFVERLDAGQTLFLNLEDEDFLADFDRLAELARIEGKSGRG
jgi:hypothetical protein